MALTAPDIQATIVTSLQLSPQSTYPIKICSELFIPNKKSLHGQQSQHTYIYNVSTELTTPMYSEPHQLLLKQAYL